MHLVWLMFTLTNDVIDLCLRPNQRYKKDQFWTISFVNQNNEPTVSFEKHTKQHFDLVAFCNSYEFIRSHSNILVYFSHSPMSGRLRVHLLLKMFCFCTNLNIYFFVQISPYLCSQYLKWVNFSWDQAELKCISVFFVCFIFVVVFIKWNVCWYKCISLNSGWVLCLYKL